jgi:hypothetical protein
VIGAVAVLFSACSFSSDARTGDGVGHVHVTFTAGGDTTGFQIPIRARRCGDGHGVVLDGALHGDGLLVWLRNGSGPLDGGNYALLSRGDSAVSRGAITAIRYIVGTVAHGLTVDSGTAVVTHEQPPYAVTIKGSGAEIPATGRRRVDVTIDRVPLGRDTVNCLVQL